MQNYIKTILSAFKTWTQKKIKDSTADWNENDSSKSSYVKNRTHWEEQDGTIHKLDKKYLDLPTNLATTDDVESAKQEALDVAGAAQTTADVKSNWNENDESSVGYVLNRTHYVTYNKLNTNYYWEHQLLANDQLRLSKSMYISFKHFINDCSVKPVYGDYIYNLHSKIIDKNTVNCLYTSPDSNVSINIILDDIAEEVIVSAVGLASGLLKIAFSFPKFEEVVYKLDEKYLPNGVSTQAINSKMNTTNPVGTGSFSMNRKEGIEIGDYSMTSGYGSVANHFAENVSG